VQVICSFSMCSSVPRKRGFFPFFFQYSGSNLCFFLNSHNLLYNVHIQHIHVCYCYFCASNLLAQRRIEVHFSMCNVYIKRVAKTVKKGIVVLCILYNLCT